MSDIELYLQSSPIARDGELLARDDVGKVFDELDFQLATQSYLWALPLVSWAQWAERARERIRHRAFGSRGVPDVSGSAGSHHRERDDAVHSHLLRTEPDRTDGDRGLPPGPTAGGCADFWQREFATMGEMGPDRGEGGQYLVVRARPAVTPRETDSGCCSRR